MVMFPHHPAQPMGPLLLFTTMMMGCGTYKCKKVISSFLPGHQAGRKLNWKPCPRHGRLQHPPRTSNLWAEVGFGGSEGPRSGSSTTIRCDMHTGNIQELGSTRDRVVSASIPNRIQSCLGQCFKKVDKLAQPPKAWKNRCGY